MADTLQRVLEFIHAHLASPVQDEPGLDVLLGQLATAFGAAGAGVSKLSDGTTLLHSQTSTEAVGLALPWEKNREWLAEVRAARTALTIPRTKVGSYLIAASVNQDNSGWLWWLEDHTRATWSPELAAGLVLACQALSRVLATDGAQPRWADQMERSARQQRLEDSANVARRLAHDFGNVLTGILGFSELSLSQQIGADTPLHRYLNEVYRGAQNGAHFTQQLRLFSRRTPVSPKPCALATILRDDESRAVPFAGEFNYTAHLPAELPGLLIDADHLRQVLSALLENARDAAGPHGIVRVHARTVTLSAADCLDRFGNSQPGEHVEIVVSDDGVGLTAEAKQRLFADPFFTSKPRRRGLGLAIAYGVLFAHRGGIRLVAGENGGTRAEIVLPIADLTVVAPSTPEKADSGPREKVLVVDDDAMILQFVSATLERVGYRVTAANGAAEALQMYDAAKADPFRLVLSDILMPEVNGVELARRLIARDPEVRVLFMSGHIGNEFPRNEPQLQQFDLLSKPFRTEALLKAVKVAVDRVPPRRPTRGVSDVQPVTTKR